MPPENNALFAQNKQGVNRSSDRKQTTPSCSLASLAAVLLDNSNLTYNSHQAPVYRRVGRIHRGESRSYHWCWSGFESGYSTSKITVLVLFVMVYSNHLFRFYVLPSTRWLDRGDRDTPGHIYQNTKREIIGFKRTQRRYNGGVRIRTKSEAVRFPSDSCPKTAASKAV